MVDAASMRQVEQQILCPYCGKKGHAKKDWKCSENAGCKGDSKGKSKSDGKEKEQKGNGKGKDDGKERRSPRKTSAIGADRQAAMGAMQVQMGIETLQVAALRKGLL